MKERNELVEYTVSLKNYICRVYICRSLQGNPLDCDCYMFYTLNVTLMSIQAAHCLTPAAATNVSFGSADSNLPIYSLNVGIESFLCCKFPEFNRLRTYLISWLFCMFACNLVFGLTD